MDVSSLDIQASLPLTALDASLGYTMRFELNDHRFVRLLTYRYGAFGHAYLKPGLLL